MKKYLIIAIAIFSGHLISAQDFHLAQYDAANLYMNPATTGMFEGKPGSYLKDKLHPDVEGYKAIAAVLKPAVDAAWKATEKAYKK